MAAPTFVNAGTTGTQAFGTSFTGSPPGLPASRVNGNILVCIVTGQATSVAHTYNFGGGGWTQFDNISQTEASCGIAWRVVDGTEAVPAVSWNGNESTAAIILQYSGCNGSPIGATHHTYNSTNSATSTDTGVTMTRANSAAILVSTGSTLSRSVTTPPGGSWTQRYVNVAGDASIAVYDNTTFSAIGNATGTWSVIWNASSRWGSFTFELASEGPIVSLAASLSDDGGISTATATLVETNVDLDASLADDTGISTATLTRTQFLSASLADDEGMQVGQPDESILPLPPIQCVVIINS